MQRTQKIRLSGLAIVAALAMLPASAFAASTWTAYSDDGVHYGIKDSKTDKIMLNVSQDEATKAAAAINKALKKDKADK